MAGHREQELPEKPDLSEPNSQDESEQEYVKRQQEWLALLDKKTEGMAFLPEASKYASPRSDLEKW